MTIKLLRDGCSRMTVKEQAEVNKNSITHLIKTLATRQEKRDLVAERNPLHYMFGEKLVTRRYGEAYEEYVGRQYIGEIT